jgi:hypothetical protein
MRYEGTVYRAPVLIPTLSGASWRLSVPPIVTPVPTFRGVGKPDTGLYSARLRAWQWDTRRHGDASARGEGKCTGLVICSHGLPSVF